MTPAPFGLMVLFFVVFGPIILAHLLRNHAEKITALLQTSNAETATALSQIYTLVNSNLTAAQLRELDSSRAMLAAMREVITLKGDRPVAGETLDTVRRVEARIDELQREATRLAMRPEGDGQPMARNELGHE